jgi:energy-coupling factor transport system ATP-binding protein
VLGKGVIALDAPIRQALHATDLLQSTYLAPPQIVQLAQYITQRSGVALPILTPEELATCVRTAEVAA